MIVASPGDRGKRLDAFLAQAFPEHSRAFLQRLVGDGLVEVDGVAAKIARRLRGGEVLSVRVPAPVPAAAVPEEVALSILHEDESLVVVDKPAGMVVHAGPGHASGTLVNAVLFHARSLSGVGGVLRPGVVHRLDKDTSGVLVLAKDDQAHHSLQEQFQARTVEKTYRALVWGAPPDEGEWRTAFGRSPRSRTKFTGRVNTGKLAVTRFQVLARGREGAELSVALETGRTHQIRVHCAEAGFPILGDSVYGGRRKGVEAPISRQALHAWRLAFRHPRTGKLVKFEAPLPKDYVAARKSLLKSK